MRTAGALWLLWVACTCPPPTPVEAPPPPGRSKQTRQLAGEGRIQLVPMTHRDFARVEGAGYANACTSDDQCFVGGCSGEICTATPDLSSTCEEREWPSSGGLCGCLEGKCRWYQDAPATEPKSPAPDAGVGSATSQ